MAIRAEGDADLDALRAALATWKDILPEPMTAAEAISAARAQPEYTALIDALATLANVKAKDIDALSLAAALRRVRNRIADGLRFDQAGTDRRRKSPRWTVKGE